MFTMPNTPLAACLLICEGSDCRKKQAKAYAALVRAAEQAGVSALPVKCQGSCVGPTAVVVDDSGPRWFEDLRSEKARRDLILSATRVSLGGKAKPSQRLKDREMTGKKRKKAAKRLAKQAA